MSAYDTLEGEDSELTLSMLKKYYKGKIIHPELCKAAAAGFCGKEKPYNITCWENAEEHTIEIEFSYMHSWNGEEKQYDCVIKCKPGRIISSVGALHCQRYCWSDARGDGYRGCRAEDFDFYLLDKILDYSCTDPEKPEP